MGAKHGEAHVMIRRSHIRSSPFQGGEYKIHTQYKVLLKTAFLTNSSPVYPSWVLTSKVSVSSTQPDAVERLTSLQVFSS